MNAKVTCMSKDGKEIEPSKTKVPDDICQLIHSMAEQLRKENIKKAI